MKRIASAYIVCSCFAVLCDDTSFHERYIGTPPVQVASDLRKMQEAPVQVSHVNYHLLYGVAGNGVRMTAQLYATSHAAQFKEVPFAELLSYYKKNGGEYVRAVFDMARKSAEETGKQVVLYIPGIDELAVPEVPSALPRVLAAFQEAPNNFLKSAYELEEGRAREADAQRQHDVLVADHRIVLELVRIEMEKEENAGKVLTILSTHHIENVEKAFIKKLACPIIEVAFDVYKLAGVFVNSLMREDDFLYLKSRITDLGKKVPAGHCGGIEQQMHDLELLDAHGVACAEAFVQLKQKNDACWFDQKEYRESRKILFDVYAQTASSSAATIAACDKALTSGVDASYAEYYATVKACMPLYAAKTSLRRLFLESPDLVLKIQLKVAQNPTCRAVKILAMRIVNAADQENGGFISKEILLRFLN